MGPLRPDSPGSTIVRALHPHSLPPPAGTVHRTKVRGVARG